MKKLSLVFIALFSVGYLMAQNTSNTKQTGEGNEISVAQTGTNNLVGRVANASSAVTVSSQTGDDNEATVTQDGTGNKAFFEQGTSLRYPGTLPATGDNNEITISQTGLNNNTWGYSLGSDNIVNVTQATGGDVVQTNGPNTSKHWLWGNNNHATMTQTGGTGNYAEIAANSSDNIAGITQVGARNWGSIGQGWIGYGSMSLNTATISQTGDRNVVSLAAGATFTPAIPGYTSDLDGLGIQQYGLHNTGTVTQTGSDNQAAIYQYGSQNEGTIVQSTDFNKANLIQLGDGNSASITQEFGNSNVVNLKQDGLDGEATILQHGTGNVVKGLGLDVMATSFDGSDLNVDQFGTSNILNLKQEDGASATVYQNGTSNVATVIQNQ